MNSFGFYAALSFVAAAAFGLVGTNTQAALARSRLLTDANALVTQSGQLWTPIRWLVKPSRRRTRTRLEAELRRDLQAWPRYEVLCRELFAWNALESGAAMALAASVAGVVALLTS